MLDILVGVIGNASYFAVLLNYLLICCQFSTASALMSPKLMEMDRVIERIHSTLVQEMKQRRTLLVRAALFSSEISGAPLVFT